MLDAIEYQDIKQPALSGSIYIGSPSDSMEAAWDKLWKCKDPSKTQKVQRLTSLS